MLFPRNKYEGEMPENVKQAVEFYLIVDKKYQKWNTTLAKLIFKPTRRHDMETGNKYEVWSVLIEDRQGRELGKLTVSIKPDGSFLGDWVRLSRNI